MAGLAHDGHPLRGPPVAAGHVRVVRVGRRPDDRDEVFGQLDVSGFGVACALGALGALRSATRRAVLAARLLLLLGSLHIRQRVCVQAQCHVEGRGEGAVGDGAELSLGRKHCRLPGIPVKLRRQPGAVVRGPAVPEDQKSVLGEQHLCGELAFLHLQSLCGGGQQLRLPLQRHDDVAPWSPGRALPPPQQEHGARVPEVREPVVQAVERVRRLEEALLHWVQHDVPERHGRAQEGSRPGRSPEALPLLAGQRLVRVAAHHQERVQDVHEHVPPALEPHRHEHDREEGSQDPQVPSVQVREADNERDGRRRVQREARHELAGLRGQRRVPDLRRRPPAGRNRHHVRYRREQVHSVLPHIRVARRVRQREDDAELRPQRGRLLRRRHRGGWVGLRRAALCLLGVLAVEAAAGHDRVGQSEAD
mmetsp:Transcript_93112/g.252585  ORF Transcript_93112/g.252585 Transcript_93112/m.252585 type:complete len:421 (+) Transcript_93112:172-1434(+)